MTREDINEAKRRLPLPELMKQLGFGEQAKKNARCPFHHADTNPSFSVWQANNGAWFWKCHAGCGEGDEISFLAKRRAVPFAKAAKLYLEMAGVIDQTPKPKQALAREPQPGNGAISLSSTEEAAIASLAALSSPEYERQRKEWAKRLSYRAVVLDKLVEEKRAKGNGALQGNAMVLPEIELWPESVNGAQTLDEIAETFRRYVAFPRGGADALALWCAHSHLFHAFLCSPRLNISSPERGCGKTTLRDVISLFVPRPVLTENLSVAVLFRIVDAHTPVILADEYDAWLKDNEELRGLLNAGHRRGAKVYRCEGDGHEVRGFNAYTPAVLCGIGALPGTLHDRSIVLRLERAKQGELSARFDPRHTDSEKELCRKLARWCADNRERIAACDPVLPDGVFNRQADNWRPLFAIAEIAGGNWPKRCADAFAQLTSRNDVDAESLRVNLLADIRQIFTGERMFSSELIDALQQMSERPWAEVNRGRPITERWLARNLAAFGIHSKTLRIGEDRAKGYELADFSDAFERYVSGQGDFIRDSVTYEGKSDSSTRDKRENVTDEKTASTEGMSRCHAYGSPEGQNVEDSDTYEW